MKRLSTASVLLLVGLCACDAPSRIVGDDPTRELMDKERPKKAVSDHIESFYTAPSFVDPSYESLWIYDSSDNAALTYRDAADLYFNESMEDLFHAMGGISLFSDFSIGNIQFEDAVFSTGDLTVTYSLSGMWELTGGFSHQGTSYVALGGPERYIYTWGSNGGYLNHPLSIVNDPADNYCVSGTAITPQNLAPISDSTVTYSLSGFDHGELIKLRAVHQFGEMFLYPEGGSCTTNATATHGTQTVYSYSESSVFAFFRGDLGAPIHFCSDTYSSGDTITFPAEKEGDCFISSAEDFYVWEKVFNQGAEGWTKIPGGPFSFYYPDDRHYVIETIDPHNKLAYFTFDYQ